MYNFGVVEKLREFHGCALWNTRNIHCTDKCTVGVIKTLKLQYPANFACYCMHYITKRENTDLSIVSQRDLLLPVADRPISVSDRDLSKIQ